MKKPVKPTFKSSIKAKRPKKPQDKFFSYHVYNPIPGVDDKAFVSDKSIIGFDNNEYYPTYDYYPIKRMIDILKNIEKNMGDVFIQCALVKIMQSSPKEEMDKYDKEMKEYNKKTQPDKDKARMAFKKYKTELAEYELYTAKQKYEKAMEEDV